MKKAPNWYNNGDPVDGVWKQDLLRFLGKEFNLKILVETGTCEGSTIQAIHNDFDEIHSIELAYYYWDIAKKRIGNLQNVHLYLGNSDYMLEEILLEINNTRLLFWLDAHSSGGLTANEGDPLPHEIAAIKKYAGHSIVVIDDQHNADLAQVIAAGVSLEDWEIHFITGVIIMFRKGWYTLPPFED